MQKKREHVEWSLVRMKVLTVVRQKLFWSITARKRCFLWTGEYRVAFSGQKATQSEVRVRNFRFLLIVWVEKERSLMYSNQNDVHLVERRSSYKQTLVTLVEVVMAHVWVKFKGPPLLLIKPLERLIFHSFCNRGIWLEFIFHSGLGR